MSAAAVIMRRQRQFIRGFAERGATCPDRAIAFADWVCAARGFLTGWLHEGSSLGLGRIASTWMSRQRKDSYEHNGGGH